MFKAGRDVVATSLVVAAHDSRDKSSSDYICDGDNDEIEINKAINVLCS